MYPEVLLTPTGAALLHIPVMFISGAVALTDHSNAPVKKKRKRRGLQTMLQTDLSDWFLSIFLRQENCCMYLSLHSLCYGEKHRI